MAKRKISEIVINKAWCKACKLCIENCPKNVLELSDEEKASVARIEDCIACSICERFCPDLAIKIEFEVEKTG